MWNIAMTEHGLGGGTGMYHVPGIRPSVFLSTHRFVRRTEVL